MWGDKATRMGILTRGGMAERFKAPALKAGEGLRPPGVRIPVPPPPTLHFSQSRPLNGNKAAGSVLTPDCLRGDLRKLFGKKTSTLIIPDYTRLH